MNTVVRLQGVKFLEMAVLDGFNYVYYFDVSITLANTNLHDYYSQTQISGSYTHMLPEITLTPPVWSECLHHSAQGTRISNNVTSQSSVVAKCTTFFPSTHVTKLMTYISYKTANVPKCHADD